LINSLLTHCEEYVLDHRVDMCKFESYHRTKMKADHNGLITQKETENWVI